MVKTKSHLTLFKIIRDTVLGYMRLWHELTRPNSTSAISSADNRLLLLVGEFAPSIAGGVYRPAALVRYAKQSKWLTTVVTGGAPEQPSTAGLELLEYVGSPVHIERFCSSGLVPSVRFFPQIDGGMLTALEMVNAARRRFGSDIPRTIFASGPPFSSFVAGLFLSRDTSRRLILEYRDEWSENPFDFVSKSSTDTKWEVKCLARANQIIVTTESQRTHLIEKFGAQIAYKCCVVPNGWEPAAIKLDEMGLSAEHQTRVVLTFAGKLGGHTDPSHFFSTLDKLIQRRPDLLKHLLIRLVGAKTARAAEVLSSFRYQQIIESIPVVSLATATRLMRESDALLLFHDIRFRRYLPGKLYEYAASSTPILLIDDDGESDRLIRELNIGWSIRSDQEDEIESVINLLLARQKQPSDQRSLKNVKLDSWLKMHTREALTCEILKIMSGTIEHDSMDKTV